MGPGVAAPRVLQDSAPAPYSGQGSFEATAVVTLLLALSGQLDGQRLAEPHLAPALAWGMSHDRRRPWIGAGVTIFIPRIDVRQSEIAAASLDEQCSDHGFTWSGRETVLRSNSLGGAASTIAR